MQKCFIFLRFIKLCSCVELYSPKKLLATSFGDPNCSTISSYLRAVGCSDSNSDSRFFKDDSISFFSFPLQHSWFESSFKYVLMALFFKGSANEEGISNVRIAVWTEANGEDDIEYIDAESLGNETKAYPVYIQNHNNEKEGYVLKVSYTNKAGEEKTCENYTRISLE